MRPADLGYQMPKSVPDVAASSVTSDTVKPASGGPLLCMLSHALERTEHKHKHVAGAALTAKTCHEKLLRVTLCYITPQMSLSAGGGLKDLPPVRLYVPLRDSVIHCEINKECIDWAVCVAALQDVSSACFLNTEVTSTRSR